MTNESLRINEIGFLIEQAYSVLEERKSLIQINLSPTVNDTQDLITALNKIVQKLEEFQNLLTDIIESKDVKKSETLVKEFKEKVREHQKLLDNIELANEKEQLMPRSLNSIPLNVDQYKFVPRELPQISPSVKTVRFKDNLIETSPTIMSDPGTTKASKKVLKPYKDEEPSISESVEAVHFSDSVHTSTASELAAQQHDKAKSQLFAKPYKDSESESNSSETDSLSNRQIFIQQQQSLLAQDDTLDELSNSIRRQQSIGLTINNELDSQTVLLDDLEAQVDSSQRRVTKARRNLDKVNKRMKEHGHCLTIAILTLILFVLVVLI